MPPTHGAWFRHGADTVGILATRDIWRVHTMDQARDLLARAKADDPDRYEALLAPMRTGQRDDNDEAAHARLTERFACGEMLLVKVKEVPRVLDAPKIRPLITDNDRHHDNPVTRPTWISIEVIGENGVRTPGLGVQAEFPDGTRRVGRLDSGSRWRADDVPTRGICKVTLDQVAIDGATGASASTSDGEWFDASRPRALALQTERHHRLVAVAGRTQIRLIDALGRAVASTRCTVQVGGRDLQGKTASDGMFAFIHPRAAPSCDVAFPDYDTSACVPA